MIRCSRLGILTCLRWLVSLPGTRALLASIVTWLFVFTLCKQRLWRDPHSGFFEDATVYDLGYSAVRLREAREYIHHAETYPPSDLHGHSTTTPVLCAGLVTFKRDGPQYLSDTVGSMLEGLTVEERSALDIRILFAHTEPQIHPDWQKKWLALVDHWSGYNLSKSELTFLQRVETEQNFYIKGLFDYVNILSQCLTETAAPYIAIFEDDIVFADGWVPKALDALAELRQRTIKWLYLRLFFTETSLGWESAHDFWYRHRWLTVLLAMQSTLFVSLGLRFYRPLRPHLDSSTIAVLTLIAAPAFTLLAFMIGKYNLMPLRGVERMDHNGCCTQALIYPRHQLDGLIQFLEARGDGQTDSLIEEYADTTGLERYALAPQLVQHVGLVSSRNNLAINTKSTWAFWFEAQDAVKLKKAHAEMARSGIWRATGDGSA